VLPQSTPGRIETAIMALEKVWGLKQNRGNRYESKVMHRKGQE